MNYFHTSMDWVSSIATIALASISIYSKLSDKQIKYIENPNYGIVLGILGYFLYPVFLETIMNLTALNFSSKESQMNKYAAKKLKFLSYLGIIYSSGYNISFLGLENLHPFDSTKHKRVFKLLQTRHGIIKGTSLIHRPSYPSRKTLLRYISKLYLLKLNYSMSVANIVELPLHPIPACILRSVLLNPMLLAAQGTVDSVAMAFSKGYAFNLSGGYHHASRNSGEGFCVYCDISMAVGEARRLEGVEKVAIIDLDAHMGNGHERDFQGCSDTHIIDFYNPRVFPDDQIAEQSISTKVHVLRETEDIEYIEKLRDVLEKDLEDFKPDFVVYNAGTDCMVGDVLGGLNISKEAIVERDEIVFKSCYYRKIPIVYLLSGGYQEASAPCIAESISNIFSRVIADGQREKV